MKVNMEIITQCFKHSQGKSLKPMFKAYPFFTLRIMGLFIHIVMKLTQIRMLNIDFFYAYLRSALFLKRDMQVLEQLNSPMIKCKRTILYS